MRKDEHKHMPDEAPNAKVKQDDILRSIHLLVSKAEHYIYIENQFFVSAFETSSIRDKDPLSPVADSINPSVATFATRILPDDEAPKNPVAEWLGDRIKRAIFSAMEQPFHVYIVLPVNPEGRLDDPTIVAQIHLTRQSLVFGSHSLLNRIRRSLWVRQQLEAQSMPRKAWYLRIPELEELCGERYKDIDFSACDTYVTLLNLRDHAELNGKPMTEQIYVHSKLMIVDDRYVLVGSANINDRSLQGDRDSELAVLISDTAHGFADLDGTGKASPFRHFARELRQNAWRKWLGSAAGECAEALDKPALKTSWEKIQMLAKDNARNYEAVFDFIPKNYEKNKIHSSGIIRPSANSTSTSDDNSPASVWPVITANAVVTSLDKENMPFTESFWQKNNMAGSRVELKNIKGYFTAIPVHWTEGENNLLPYNMRLIASNDVRKDYDYQIADNRAINGFEGDLS